MTRTDAAVCDDDHGRNPTSRSVAGDGIARGGSLGDVIAAHADAAGA
jgi:hypothetical protein